MAELVTDLMSEDEIRKRVSRGLKKLRERQRPAVSREKLARALGVSAQSIRRWEEDETAPDLFNVVRFVQALHGDLGRLLD